MTGAERQDELRRSEQRFRATFEQAAVGMAHIAPDGAFLRVNGKWCSMLRYDSCEQMGGKRVQDVTHAEDLSEDEAEMRRLLDGAISTYTLRKRYFRSDGSTMWGRNTVSLVRDEQGEPEYFVSVLIDITDRVEADRRLRESEELFRLAFEQAAVGMAQVGKPNEPWLRMNERFCEILGYECDELMTLTPRDVTHPEDRERDMQQAEDVWGGRAASASADKRYIRKDGSVVWVERTLSALRDPSGRPYRFLVVIEDITERVEAVQRLRETEERFRLLFENANENIAVYRVIYAEDGRLEDMVLEDVNPAMLRQMDGRSRSDLRGNRMSDLFGGAEIMRPYLELAGQLVAKGTSSVFDLYFEPADRYFIVSVYPLGGDLWAIVAMDVTEQRRAQEELKRRDEEIRQAYEDVLDAVTGGKLVLMTHDELEEQLREPLSPEFPITSPEELAEARSNIRAAIGPLDAEIATSMKLMNPVGEALNNALKHASGGTYRVYADAGCIQVEVTDNGPGIDFRALPHSTLVAGYSTTATLGVGFTIMLQLADRVLLATRPGRTSVVLEVSRDDEGASACERPADRD